MPPEFDTTTAHSARVYDFYLGGTDHFAVDRETGLKAMQSWPAVRTAVRENRAFLGRAVRYLAGEAGIRQFLDIGSGLPSAENVHEVAQAVAPRSRVVYVDNDPAVLTHARTLLTSAPGGQVAYFQADLRDPEKILASPVVAGTLDLTKPVALMLVAVLDFLTDATWPTQGWSWSRNGDDPPGPPARCLPRSTGTAASAASPRPGSCSYSSEMQSGSSEMHSGRHFLQIPGPTNVPDRVLRAIAAPVIDHRGPEFAALFRDIMPGLRRVFGTEEPVVIFPSSGTGAWEAALVNTLSPGDTVLIAETGHFAALWAQLAGRLGLRPEVMPGDWRHGADPDAIGRRLAADTEAAVKAVLVVHNETSTGVTSRVPEIRAEMDRAGHQALLIVDTISSLGSMPYRHDDWGVDVTVGGSQKGLMLPPGLGFNAVGRRARDASARAALPRAYWDWGPVLSANEHGFYPYTPATNLLYGLREALTMLHEEGLTAVWDRHARHGEATRRAVGGWGLEVQCADPREYSSSLTAVVLPAGHDADKVREIILGKFDMSLGTGLGRLAGRVFRIGHLGHFNDLSLAGALCGVEMGLQLAGVPIEPNGVAAALAYLRTT